MLIRGNEKILGKILALVLNSSQSKTPCGGDLWVQATKSAIQRLVEENYAIISSLGMATWELPIFLVSKLNGNHVIISPVFVGENVDRVYQNTLCEFGLDENSTVMVFVESSLKSNSPKINWPARDKEAMELAQVIAPISIREGGRLDKMLANFTTKINNAYRTDFRFGVSHPAHYTKSSAKIDFKKWNHIAHWTKTRIGPWPGELKRDYYAGLVNSGERYRGNAFATLLRIIGEKKIRASSEKIREKSKVVGFSSASPNRIIEMMRWCPKKVNWNFEPYGIAIDKEYAASIGIKPVLYGDDKDYAHLAECEKPFFHGRGRETVDWTAEQEWRHLGDLDLSIIPQDKISYFVWNRQEAEIVSGLISGTVHSFSIDL